jgi:hypothetical protein
MITEKQSYVHGNDEILAKKLGDHSKKKFKTVMDKYIVTFN